MLGFSYEFADTICYVSLDILERISYLRIYSFIIIKLDILENSYMIACTNTEGFEEGESCASTILVEHTLGYDIKLIGYDMMLLGSIFQDLSVLLVAVLTNFGVKNQVP